MKINLNSKLMALEMGKPMMLRKEDDVDEHVGRNVLKLLGPECLKKVLKDRQEDVEFKLFNVCVNSLYAIPIDEKTQKPKDMPVEEKLAKHKLLGKVANARKGIVDFDVEDVVLLKKLINDTYKQAHIVGQAYDLLAGREIEVITPEEREAEEEELKASETKDGEIKQEQVKPEEVKKEEESKDAGKDEGGEKADK